MFRITTAGTLTTLHTFYGAGDGNTPYARLIQGADGNLYGTTSHGGNSGEGVVFKITTSGILTTLHSFRGADGRSPYASLVQTGGNFYGTTDYGGASDDGTIFRITPAGTLTTLYSFCSQTGCADGMDPLSGLVQASDGNLYGTTAGGGSPGPGTVFRLTLPSTNLPAPSITASGVVPVFSTATTIQTGEWVSIYGANLAASNVTWNGNFPTYLGGTTVTIDGFPAYLWYVSPSQINLQVPNDSATGTVPVVVTTPSGTFTSTVTLAGFAPSFSLLDGKHVAGIIPRSNGSGAYGGGTYDILGPTGTSLGYRTVAAKAGDTVELYAVGLGPTNPVVLPGQVFTGSAPTVNSPHILINNVSVTTGFAGLSSAGLYQINLLIPAGLGTGDVPLLLTIGGVQTPSNVVISLQ